jgi:hypothetical protein
MLDPITKIDAEIAVDETITMQENTGQQVSSNQYHFLRYICDFDIFYFGQDVSSFLINNILLCIVFSVLIH